MDESADLPTDVEELGMIFMAIVAAKRLKLTERDDCFWSAIHKRDMLVSVLGKESYERKACCLLQTGSTSSVWFLSIGSIPHGQKDPPNTLYVLLSGIDKNTME